MSAFDEGTKVDAGTGYRNVSDHRFFSAHKLPLMNVD
jgi:hypothetical protein